MQTADARARIRHAGLHRREFRTHLFNTTSRAAIEWLGAKLDGVLCSYQLLADGSRRDTVVCSVLDIEWPAVRNNLRFRPGQAVSRPD